MKTKALTLVCMALCLGLGACGDNKQDLQFAHYAAAIDAQQWDLACEHMDPVVRQITGRMTGNLMEQSGDPMAAAVERTKTDEQVQDSCPNGLQYAAVTTNIPLTVGEILSAEENPNGGLTVQTSSGRYQTSDEGLLLETPWLGTALEVIAGFAAPK